MENLPAEVLTTVLENGMQPYTISDFTVFPQHCDYRTKVSTVCKFWKQVAYSTPTLWSLIHIRPLGKGEEYYHRWRGWLERAAAIPLDVILDARKSGVYAFIESLGPEFNQFWNELKIKSSQWRTLFLRNVCFQSEADLYRIFPSDLPNLIQSTFCVTGYAIPRGRRFIQAPRLMQHSSENTGLFPFTEVNNLRVLIIATHFYPFVHLFPSLPTIQDLHLVNILPTSRANSVSSTLNLPFLTSLTFHESDIGYLFRWLIAPRLESITLTSVTRYTFQGDWDDISFPLDFPLLTTLTISKTTYAVRAGLQFAQALKSPSNLTVVLGGTRYWPNKGMSSNDFFVQDSMVRWLEETVAAVRIHWNDMTPRVGEDFLTWEEARNHYAEGERES